MRPGGRLFLRDTHRVVATSDGEAMVAFARSVLEVNERARQYFSGAQLRGRVRFGTSDDFCLLPPARNPARVTRRHPGVDLELTVDLSARLNAQIDDGELDLVLAKRRSGEQRGTLVWRDQLSWICGPGLSADPQAPAAADPLRATKPDPRDGAGNAGAEWPRLACGVHQRQPQWAACGGSGGVGYHNACA